MQSPARARCPALGVLTAALLAGTALAGPDVLIADFETSVRTAQGGYFRAVGGRPTVVRDGLAELGQPAAWAWRIDVLAGAPATGVGGFVPLFDNQRASPDRRPVDVSATPFVELTLIGDLGQRTLRVEVNAEIVNDPDVAGTEVATFEPGKLDTERWRSLLVRLPMPTVGAIRLILAGEGPAWVAVDRLRLSPTNDPPAWNPPPAESPRPLRLALWVWKTTEILSQAGETDALLAFCRQHELTDLYFQIPYAYEGGAVTLKLVEALRAFNVAARRANIRVHALDGNARYVLPENHARMFALVEALDRFNREGPPEGRFDALHLDNEPYVMPEWKSDPTRRPAILAAYIELNRELRRRANAAGLELGVDIPFWFDRKEASGGPMFAVDTPAGRAGLLETLFGIVQNVGVMSYRERVLGPDGVVGVCRDEFELGQRHGVDVFASIELGTGSDVEEGISFGRLPKEYFATQLATLRRVLAHEPGCRGLAIHYYSAYRQMETQR